MPLNVRELHLSTTSGQENNGFLLCFGPLLWLEEASPRIQWLVGSFKAKID